MTESHHPRFLRLAPQSEAALIAGARDISPVCGLTHGFYTENGARIRREFAGRKIPRCQAGDSGEHEPIGDRVEVCI
jgi:hypothetical protein